MRILPKILALVVVVALSPIAAHARTRDKWLSYYPAVVELTGTLRIVPMFGPPNYGENPESDSRLKVPVLDLVSPINVRGDPSSNINSQSFRGLTRVQLDCYTVEMRKRINDLAGSEVVVVGSLFQAITARHYTPVVLFVEEIRRADR
ncbi:MAG: hypothetical protein KatS3mg077_2893 [Candidatus Binatia bacterium]|nr:MAG: hypothetical protein KatS3mg077_2893 [Candidatus Binatia bacterium]